MTAGLHSDLCSLYTSGVFLYESRCFSSLARGKVFQVYSGFHVHAPIINKLVFFSPFARLAQGPYDSERTLNHPS